jgi:hypothetical protein
MEITQERREQLLRGVDPSASAYGERWCPDARSAPRWAQDRIVEVRAAILDGKPVPPPSRAYVQAAEMRQQIAHFNRTHASVMVPRRRPAAKPSSVLSIDEARRLAKEYGVSFEDVTVARSLEKTAGVPLEDTLARIRLRADAARIRKAQELEDEDEFKDDPDEDWDADRHSRTATRHRVLAQKSNFEDGCAHLKCADAHSHASNNFSTDNSRKARTTSRLAFPESVIS